MKINIRDLMENIEDSSVDLEETNVVSSERIKELTKMKINELGVAPKRKSKKTIITVLIAVAVVSALGITTFAAINGGLASRTFGKSTWAPEDETYVDSDGEEYTFPEREFISLQGYADSPEFQATGEWLEFEDGYDRDFSIVTAFDEEVKRTGVDPFEEKYGAYLIYSQEMADKVDEITAKYNLQLHKNLSDCDTDIVREKFGNVFSEEVFGAGYMYDDGTFQLDGTYKNIEFQIRRCMRGYFDTVYLNVGNIDNYEQWTYVTKDGYTVYLGIRSDGHAVISIDLEDSFVSMSIMPWDSDLNQVIHTREELEDLVDQIDFSLL
ncbi:MAG: hypothetical protein IIY21_09905 [Clostridiales bacterium]|nr:hypothetical protein [Clostridiales bacterium]MBQ1571564.1 hypothetical protein [Clostridiales bacterium]MBQ2608866.1 hypothetical protein [Butyrivibrio sp.]MBQ5768736.1 hypothetical protein [Clostridiales bacterium]